MGVHDLAEVRSIEPCPVDAGAPLGGLVTGTFVTESVPTVSVYTDSLAGPVGATAGHPFYSVDRAAWVAAGQLKPGERVRTAAGEATVDRVEPGRTPQTVYNIEVQGTHTYFVSGAMVLVHNACTAGQVNIRIRRGQAPKSMKMAEPAKIAHDLPHIHFRDGKHALNWDGTWRHGGRALSNAEKDFIKAIEWVLP